MAENGRLTALALGRDVGDHLARFPHCTNDEALRRRRLGSAKGQLAWQQPWVYNPGLHQAAGSRSEASLGIKVRHVLRNETRSYSQTVAVRDAQSGWLPLTLAARRCRVDSLRGGAVSCGAQQVQGRALDLEGPTEVCSFPLRSVEKHL